MSDLADWASRVVVPALEDFGRWLDQNKGQIEDTAASIGNRILPPLKALADLVIGAAKAFASLPGPVKEFGAEALIAAYALPKLNAAMTLAGTGMVNFGTKVKAAKFSMAGLGRGLTTVAGVGGMIALQEGAQHGSKALTTLGGALTGAAAGAALGSVFPGVGTAIGAVGGAAVGAGISLWQMHDAEKASGDAASAAKPKFDDWAATLDQTTGAFTRSTRAMVLQKLQADGMIGGLQQLGISTRDAIGATLGNAGAMRRVANATKGNTDILKGLTNVKLQDWLYKNRDALKAQQDALRQDNQDILTWKQALRGLPKKLVTQIAAAGTDISMKRVRELARAVPQEPPEARHEDRGRRDRGHRPQGQGDAGGPEEPRQRQALEQVGAVLHAGPDRRAAEGPLRRRRPEQGAARRHRQGEAEPRPVHPVLHLRPDRPEGHRVHGRPRHRLEPQLRRRVRHRHPRRRRGVRGASQQRDRGRPGARPTPTPRRGRP